jgi:hypothetical protein
VLLPPFGVLRDGEPIELVPLRRTVATGIVYDDPRIALGMVAEFEEREAAVHTGIGWVDWLGLPLRERAAGVAHYRLQYLIQMHGHDAVTRDSEMQERRARRRQAVEA